MMKNWVYFAGFLVVAFSWLKISEGVNIKSLSNRDIKYKYGLSAEFNDPNPGSTGCPDAVEALERHNELRKQHNAPALKWSDSLAQEAREWANHMASTKKFAHASAAVRNNHGENLAWLSSSRPAYQSTDMWYTEIRDYDFAHPGFNHATGHFTQVVWRDTKQVGIACAKNGKNTYVVARYDPPGNFRGQFKDNVISGSV
uniref:Toxin candidate TRINITY_DN24577_c0_g1_i1 n=1 Tax=Pachycerianthus borealis TaxID=2736680 RepID=A0A7G7WYX9_9CNID|nr:toxin candidate TRINITY_DN24577_c0_g1_i1 [Pachycerianthus borealis]